MKRKLKPKRPILSVLKNFYQILAADSDISQKTWQSEHAHLQSGDSDLIRLLIWNIFKANSGQSLYDDLKVLTEQVDISILQEVLGLDAEFHSLNPEGWHSIHGAGYQRRDGRLDGVLTGSRWQQQVIGHNQAPKSDPLLKTRKASLATRVFCGDHAIDILNVHFPLIRTLRQAERDAKVLVGDLATLSHHAVVAGDFNTINRQYLAVIASVLEGFGLTHVTVPRDPRASYGQLDHIFVRGFMVKKIQVLSDVTSSDHFPIMCHLIRKDVSL